MGLWNFAARTIQQMNFEMLGPKTLVGQFKLAFWKIRSQFVL